MSLEFRVLGPLEVAKDGRPLRLGGERQRALLALLLLSANRPVSTDRLIEELFGLDAPETAANALQVAISRLRRLLGDEGGEVLLTRSRGYELRADPQELDVGVFERLAAEGRVGLDAGDPAAAASKLREALALWRGPPLADLSGLDFAQIEIHRLEELRVAALMERIEADLALGRGPDLIAELEALVSEHPLQERPRGQLMLALYRAGRQADALAVYRSTRELLAEELGLEPSRALRDLERQILEHDTALLPGDAAARETGAPRRRRRLRRRWLAVGAAGLAGVAAIGIVLGLRRGGHAPVVVKPGSVVRIDLKSNRIVESVHVGREPGSLIATPDAVWTANEKDQTLTRVDLHNHALQVIGGVLAPAFLARDTAGNVYASGWDHPWVWRVDPRTAQVVARYRVRTRALDMAVSGGSLWVVDRLANSVDRIDLARRRVADVIKVGTDPLELAAGYGGVWVANSDDATVSVISPGVRGTQRIGGLDKVFGLAAGEGAVWVGSNMHSTVTRIDPDTRRKVATIDVAPFRGAEGVSGLYNVAVGGGAVWAVNRSMHEIVRIDPHTNKVVARIPFPDGTEPRSVDVSGNDVWATVGTLGWFGP